MHSTEWPQEMVAIMAVSILFEILEGEHHIKESEKQDLC